MSARELFDLAVLADKYGCTESIQMASGYLLSNFGASSKTEDTLLATTLYLVATAFLMDECRHFTLFTRRLVMDHTDSYSAVAQHTALAMLPSLLLRKYLVPQRSMLVATKPFVQYSSKNSERPCGCLSTKR